MDPSQIAVPQIIGVVPGGEGAGPAVADGQAAPVVTTVDERTAQAGQAAAKIKKEIARRADAPKILVPVVQMTSVSSNFSLSDITSTDNFKALGSKLAANPDTELNRMLLGARVIVGADGIKQTMLVRRKAEGKIVSAPKLFAIEELRESLAEMVLLSAAVPARKEERKALDPLLDAFFAGMGEKAEEVLSANLERAGERLVALVAEEQRKYIAPVKVGYEVKLAEFAPLRATDRDVDSDRFGPFSPKKAYEGFVRSLFPVEWFDSAPERTVANIVDDDEGISCWVRLHIKELPILWNSEGQQYNPDLLVIEADETHWIVEVKSDKEMDSENVKGKREAALRWAGRVAASDEVKVPWRYLLVSETDIATAKGSWEALKRLGS